MEARSAWARSVRHQSAEFALEKFLFCKHSSFNLKSLWGGGEVEGIRETLPSQGQRSYMSGKSRRPRKMSAFLVVVVS